MSNQHTETCYACNEPATSREHVPPRCLFPNSLASGDALGTDRITVPSCDLHNGKKSGDDDLLRLALISTAKDPSTELDLTRRTVRGLVRKPALLNDVIGQLGPQFNEFGVLTGFDGTQAVLDNGAVYRALVSVARGLFFHEFGRRFAEDPMVIAPSLVLHVRETDNGPEEVTLDGLDDAMDGLPWKGAVADVFTYRCFGGRKPRSWFGVIEMHFYRKHRVFAVSGNN